jgi:hypothetical protein
MNHPNSDSIRTQSGHYSSEIDLNNSVGNVNLGLIQWHRHIGVILNVIFMKEMALTMNRDWYEALDDFRDQQAWLINNSDMLYETIEHDLQHPGRQKQALDAFLTLFPVMVRSEALKQWVSLAQHAVRQVVALPKSKPNPNGSLWLIGNRYAIQHMNYTENLRPAPSKRRRRVRINARQLYEQYLLLLMTFFCEHNREIDERHITQMLRFARSVNHVFLSHKTYQAIAVIYNEWQSFGKAKELAGLSYAYFERTGNAFEAAFSAYEVANALRGLADDQGAAAWLEIARQNAANSNDPNAIKLIMCETHQR